MDYLQFVLRGLGNKFAKSIDDYVKKEKDRKLREKLNRGKERLDREREEAEKAYDNSWVCANCGSVISDGNSFCTQCGFDKIVLGLEYKKIKLENERLKWEREHPEEVLQEKEIEYGKKLIDIEIKKIKDKIENINDARKQLYNEYFSLKDKLECPNCGATINESQKFCGICRANFAEMGIKRYNTIEFKSKLAVKYYSAFEDNGEKDNFIEELKRELNIEKANSNIFRLQNEVNKEIEKYFFEILNNMVECPVGKFMMGSNGGFLGIGGELGRNSEEIQHQVTISKSFKIGKYPVTQRLYEIIMGTKPSKHKGYNIPVTDVNWYQANGFCKRLNMLFSYKLPIGYKFDLPTEAQWEYACRAGTNTALNNGKNISTEYNGVCLNLDEVGWYEGNSGGIPHEVGQKKPNAWGIYDMHGNVSEWCRDFYDSYSNSPVTDPVGINDRDLIHSRVTRGASFDAIPKYHRSAQRGSFPQGMECCSIGFRVALVPID